MVKVKTMLSFIRGKREMMKK